MKIRISHLNGRYDSQKGTDLCELFCIPDDETNYYLFENGWLPLLNNEWYQSRSSRIKNSSNQLSTFNVKLTESFLSRPTANL